MIGYVLIALKATDEQRIYDKLSAMKDIKETHILFGEWDLIAKIQAKSPEALADFVIAKIRTLQGVKLTSTLIVAR